MFFSYIVLASFDYYHSKFSPNIFGLTRLQIQVSKDLGSKLDIKEYCTDQ